MKRVLLADDHRIIIAGLDNIIRNEFLLVEIQECRNGACVWKKVQKTAYDLVILDIMMPGTDAFHLLKNIFSWRPGQKVIIFTMNSADIYAQKYLALGVKAFINKEASPAEVGKAISAVMYDRKYAGADPSIIQAGGRIKHQPATPFGSLTGRELEIMNHLIDGKIISEIAGTLCLHISTVSTHKSNIMQKLGVSSVVELCNMVRLFM